MPSYTKWSVLHHEAEGESEEAHRERLRAKYLEFIEKFGHHMEGYQPVSIGFYPDTNPISMMGTRGDRWLEAREAERGVWAEQDLSRYNRAKFFIKYGDPLSKHMSKNVETIQFLAQHYGWK